MYFRPKKTKNAFHSIFKKQIDIITLTALMTLINIDQVHAFFVLHLNQQQQQQQCSNSQQRGAFSC